MLQAALTVLIAVAALNWTLVEFADYNVLVDLLGLTEGSQEFQAVVGVIGAAAVIRVYSVIEWVTGGN